MKPSPLLILMIGFSFFSCNENKKQKHVNDLLDSNQTTRIAEGQFISMDPDHKISGRAILISHSKNKIIRFENFSVLNGPDVNVYLSKSPDYEEVIDLGELKGTNGNINYDFNDSINTDLYKYALVWCRKYKVNFGYAELTKQGL